MALDLWSELTVEYAEEFSITYEGEGEGQVPQRLRTFASKAGVLRWMVHLQVPLDATNLVVVALEKAFETAGKEVPTLHYHCVSRIPFARGLGSSSAAIVAGLIAGLVLAGHRLAVKGSEELLQLAANIEGPYCACDRFAAAGLASLTFQANRRAPRQRRSGDLRRHPAGNPQRRAMGFGAGWWSRSRIAIRCPGID
eukprot:scaffold803_cov310-Pinguiococcus_pyrenoidosus.AAC.76